MVFPKLKAAAGPNPDPEGSDEEPDSEDLGLLPVSEVTLLTFLKFPSLHFSFQSTGILFIYYYNSSLR